MPFVEGPKKLEDAVDPTAVTRFMRDVTDDVGDHLRDSIRRRTPIDTSRAGVMPIGDPLNAMHVHAATPMTARARVPGTLHESIERGPVRRHTSVLGRGYEVRAFTRDPIARFVEDDTRAHDIAPTAAHEARARAQGKTAALAIFFRGELRFFRRVRHPGTRGQHMFARGTAWVATEIGQIARPHLDRFARDLTRHHSWAGGGLVHL